METIEMINQTNPFDEPAIYVPDDIIRSFENALRKMEAAFLELTKIRSPT